MSGLVFVDTNVFVYAIDASSGNKQSEAQRWRNELWRQRRGRISFQVLQEFYVQGLRISPADRDQLRADVRDLMSWRPVQIDAGVFESGWTIQDRYKIDFWDALIMAAAKTAGCQYVLTEDLQHEQKIAGLMVINPFRSSIESLPPA